MALTNTTERWGAVAKTFHWIIVALILLQFWLAWQAEKLPLGLAKLATYARHKSVGITILALAVLRLAWKFYNRGRSPELPGDLKPWERFLGHLTHQGLYVLLFAMPLSGWAMSSAKNYPVSWFNLVRLPDFVAPSESLFNTLHSVHDTLALALVALAALHVAAAFQHHFIRKDNILLRMLPFGRLR
ncbi:MAG: cytochrome b [Steroidobacteraceae bacterium]